VASKSSSSSFLLLQQLQPICKTIAKHHPAAILQTKAREIMTSTMMFT
jgi:hypothetical protein